MAESVIKGHQLTVKSQILFEGKLAANAIQTDFVALTDESVDMHIVGFEVAGGTPAILSILNITNYGTVRYRLTNPTNAQTGTITLIVYYT